jgi:hypothetical protein
MPSISIKQEDIMTIKTVYLYDENTGEHKGAYEAHESPLEPGQFITPIHSSPVPPPLIGVNEVAVMVSGAWAIQPDFREQTIYDQPTGTPQVVVAIGAIPTGFALTLPPAQLLAQTKATQIARLTTSYNAAIQLPVAYMATSFQADSASQDVLTKSLAPGSVPTGFAWLDANNVAVPMTFAQLQGLAAAMLAQGWAAFQNLQTRKTAVRSATTVTQVQTIIW